MNILNIYLIFNVPGFNVETVEYKNVSFTVWDVGGQDKVQNMILLNISLVFFFFLPIPNNKDDIFMCVHLLLPYHKMHLLGGLYFKNTNSWLKIVKQSNESLFATGLDSTVMETLFPEHPGSHLCGGQ